MDSNFICPRCGFSTDRKDNFKRHLGRKTVCKAKLTDIPRKIILDDINDSISVKKYKLIKIDSDNYYSPNNSSYICSSCNTLYKHKSSYNRHIKLCGIEEPVKLFKYKKQPINEDTINQQHTQSLDSNFYDEYLNLKFEQLKSEYLSPTKNKIHDINNIKIGQLEQKMLQQQVPTLAQLLTDKENNTYSDYHPQQMNMDNKRIIANNTIGNNNMVNSQVDNRYQNNQNNITNNIYINDFGKETTKHISKKDWKKIVHKLYQAIPTLVEKVHIENKENQNVFLPSIKDNYALIYEKDNWQFKALTQVLEDIISTNADRLYEFITDNQGELDEKVIVKLDNVMEQLEHNDKLYKKYQREIKYLLVNNRDMIKEHYEQHYSKPLKHR